MSLSSIEKIDGLFLYLYAKGSTYTSYRNIVGEHFKNDEVSTDIEGLLIKLDRDGYVDTGERTNNRNFDWIKETTYKLSFEGRFLFENSRLCNRPYASLKKTERYKNKLNVAKAAASAANAVIIILIAIFAVCAQRQANRIANGETKTEKTK